jgi:hypothetical protein
VEQLDTWVPQVVTAVLGIISGIIALRVTGRKEREVQRGTPSAMPITDGYAQLLEAAAERLEKVQAELVDLRSTRTLLRRQLSDCLRMRREIERRKGQSGYGKGD